MQKPVIGSITALALAILVFSPGVHAQTPSPEYDPHDLSGVWQRQGRSADGPMSQWSRDPLPFTPAGLERFNANKPGKGPRAGLPALGNDPLGGANVPGLMRTLVYGRPWQFIRVEDKWVQLFEWFRIWREIWTDGREVPEPEETYPRFYGYSIGHWEGDTLVVETVGFDPRLWMDEWGTPFSDQLRVEERWRRLSHDSLELTMTISDPETFTRPWETDPVTFRLQPKGSVNGEMLEVIFTPMDEQDFNENVRDLSNGVLP